MIFVFLALLLADNIEIPRSSFDVLKIEDMYIYSKDTEVSNLDWTSVKISFPGDHRYEIYEYEPGVLEIVDDTEYLKEKEAMKYRIDFEIRYYGLIPDAWTVVITIVVSAIAMLILPTNKL